MNRRLKKSLGVLGLAVLGGAAFSFGAMGMVNVSAETAFDTASLTMIEGASVRYYKNAPDGESGIRFTSVIPLDDYTSLEGMEATAGVSVSYGMLIAPYSYCADASLGEFTPATVFGVDGEKKYTWDGDVLQEGDTNTYTKIAHVTYETLALSQKKGYKDTHYEINGSLIDIMPENLTKEFVGRGYIKYTQADGKVSYKFADYDEGSIANNTRSIVYVAQRAIEEGDEAAEWVQTNYVDAAVNLPTTYTVETCVGDEVVKRETFDTTVNATVDVEAKEYQGFQLDATKTETTGTAYANGKLTLKHVYQKLADSEYQVKNGDFETGNLTDWTLVNENLGAVSSDKKYWTSEENGGYDFRLDGTYMFSNYAKSDGDGEIGYLQSEPFTIGASGWLTFKIGGARNAAVTYVEIINNEDGSLIKRLYNGDWKETTDGVKSGCTLNAYKVDLSNFIGTEAYIRVCDYATADYGVLFLDSFDALHICEPMDERYATAYEVSDEDKYALFNGNFDRDMNGWTEVVTEWTDDQRKDLGNISTKSEYWDTAVGFNNTGKFYCAYEPDDRYETSKGTLRSAPFTIGGCGYVTFALGGIKDFNYIWLELVDAYTGEVYAKYYNDCQDRCTLIYYKANLSRFMGKTVYFKFVDNATGNYGLIFCDEFITYYPTVDKVPNYNIARNLLTDVINGSFESFENEFVGWTIEGAAFINTASVYWEPDKSRFDENNVTVHNFHKEGNRFYTTDDAGTSTLKSSLVTVTDNYISFKLGAGRHDTCYVAVCLEDGTEIQEYKVTNSAYFNDPKLAQILLRKFIRLDDKYIGQKIFIKVVDNQCGDSFGFLTFDDLRVNMNESEAMDLLNAEKAYYGNYYQSTLDCYNNENDEKRQNIGVDTIGIINAVREYYGNLSLPA